MAERETDAECLKMLVEMHHEKLCKEETLLKVLRSPAVAEYGLALRVKSEPVPESLELERSTKAIKMEFSHLLSSLSEILKEKLPRDVIRMLGCYDKKFLALTEDCKDTGDVISEIIENISFLDYDLLQFMITDIKLDDKFKKYEDSLKLYLSKRISLKQIQFQNLQSPTVLKLDKSMGVLDEKKCSELVDTVQKLLHLDIIIESETNEVSE